MIKKIGFLSAAFATLLFILPAHTASAQNTSPFELPKLAYGYQSLAPAIDAKTMETHHSKHHKTYVDNLNSAVRGTPELVGKSLEDIVSNVSKYNDFVRNNAGGHWNHSFFWTLMTPRQQTANPPENLRKAIEANYQSVENFKKAFQEAGAAQFGSGWVWLIVNSKGQLEITTTSNQDNPLMDDVKQQGIPVLGNDVWEHAYYLTYQNKRADYLEKWWSVVNWDVVGANYDSAMQTLAAQ